MGNFGHVKLPRRLQRLAERMSMDSNARARALRQKVFNPDTAEADSIVEHQREIARLADEIEQLSRPIPAQQKAICAALNEGVEMAAKAGEASER